MTTKINATKPQYGSREWCNQWCIKHFGNVYCDADDMSDAELFNAVLSDIRIVGL